MTAPWDKFKSADFTAFKNRTNKLLLLKQVIEQLRIDENARTEAYHLACRIRNEIYGPSVFFRGLIEISNYCIRNCFYCGIRKDKKSISRYRLTHRQIISCCQNAYDAGYRTVVLQGGEDPYFTIDFLAAIVTEIRQKWPDIAITLSLGEMAEVDYLRLFQAGADRYLLRHETANNSHFENLHPQEQTLDGRLQCLRTLKQIGFQTGAGMMIGSPGQTTAHLSEDLLFMAEFQPHMIGIGPFMPAADTPFAHEKAGSITDTLITLALARILVPAVLLPATTALGSLAAAGRTLGLLAGANVIMPNISPPEHRADYLLYDCKLLAADDIFADQDQMVQIVADADMFISNTRGDAK